jgi:hypothetical protein
MPNRIALALVFVGALPAFGVDKNGTYVINGLVTCGAWHEAARDRNPNRIAYTYWLLGYISGVNYLAPGNDSRLDNDQIKAYVDRYCSNNPLHNLVLAANALIDEVGGPKAEHTWRK